MADKTGIEWTDATWNPIVGCSIVSPGCTNCYAMKMAARITAMDLAQRDPFVDDERTHYAGTTEPSKAGAVWTGHVAQAPDSILSAPLRWKKPRRVFVNSMGDLFHESIPDEWIDKVFAVMALCPQHTFQVLTKRADRMREYLTAHNGLGNAALCKAFNDIPSQLGNRRGALQMPLPNVWLGVSTERQQEADERIPFLLQTPAAVRFISAEPLLGPIDLCERWWKTVGTSRLDWVIVGGESGKAARPMHPDWARALRDQCTAAGVPFFFKQWGEWVPQVGGVDGWTIDDNPEISRFDHRDWDGDRYGEPYRPMWCDDRDDDTVSRVGKSRAGRLLDGKQHNEFPATPPKAQAA